MGSAVCCCADDKHGMEMPIDSLMDVDRVFSPKAVDESTLSVDESPQIPGEITKDGYDQQVMKTLVHSMLRGRRVVLVRELESDPYVKRLPAELSLSKDMRDIRFSGQGTMLELSASSLQDIFTTDLDGDSVLSKSFLVGLSEKERPRFVRICYRPEGEPVMAVSFLESSPSNVRAMALLLKGVHELSMRTTGTRNGSMRSRASFTNK
mmetsp:Transcript_16527/g.47950  ORF Transcript_16527/g.47950 Transcript_16527/m.47950 type:complete len:208 (-) Transcript_16527:131-754(-)